LIERFRNGMKERVRMSKVFCSFVQSVDPDKNGPFSSGRLLVRIVGETKPDIACGDQICLVGTTAWYTVAEIRRNVAPGSALSHWKVIGKR